MQKCCAVLFALQKTRSAKKHLYILQRKMFTLFFDLVKKKQKTPHHILPNKM